MKLSEAVHLYIARRRSEGAQYVNTEAVLRSLCKSCGNIELRELSAERVNSFLRTSNALPATVSTKFSAVKCLVEYLTARNQLPIIPLQRPPKRRYAKLSYIFTRKQLHVILDLAQKRNCHNDSLDGRTLRMILLLLYATGCTFSDVVSLRRADVDFSSSCITLRGILQRPRGLLPIGPDLLGELAEYLKYRPDTLDALIFISKNGEPIKVGNLRYLFARLQVAAGLTKTTAGHSPRLLDLRFTFAVHRLSSCIQRGEKLNDLIPALSTYMGYTSLTKAEEYLAFVPERFSEDLQKLSPARAQIHWRDVPGLLERLSSL